MLEEGDLFISKWKGQRGEYVAFDNNNNLYQGKYDIDLEDVLYVQLLIKIDKQVEFEERILRFFKEKIYKIEYNSTLINLRTQTPITVTDVVSGNTKGLTVFLHLKTEQELSGLELFLEYNKNYFYIYDVSFTDSLLHRFFESQKRQNMSFLKYGVLKEGRFVTSDGQLPRHKVCCFDIEAVSKDMLTVPNGASYGDRVVAVSFVIGIVEEDCSFKIEKEIVHLLWPHEIVFTAKPGREYFIHSTELELLKSVCDFFYSKLQAPILIGYNILDFDFSFLFNRMIVLGLVFEYYNIKDVNRMLTGVVRPIPCCDRLQIIDLMIYLKRMHLNEYNSFSLNNVAQQELGKVKKDISFKELYSFYNNDMHTLTHTTASANEFLSKLCDYVVYDSQLTLELYAAKKVHLSLFPLVSVCFANTVDYTSKSTSKIITCFQSIMYPSQGLCPIKYFGNRDGTTENTGDMFQSKINQYKGATVLKSPRSVFANQNLYVVDFSSLYPSLIKEYNIGINYVISDFEPSKYPVNVVKEFLKRTHKMERFYTIKRDYSSSPLAVVVDYLITQRKQTKNPYLNYTYKLIANSLYGLLASKGKLRHLPSAALVTSYGRKMHSLIKHYIENSLNLKVIGGDTDSFFILSNHSKTSENHSEKSENHSKQSKNLLLTSSTQKNPVFSTSSLKRDNLLPISSLKHDNLLSTYSEKNKKLLSTFSSKEDGLISTSSKSDENIADILNSYIKNVLKLQTISLTLDYEATTTIFLAEKKTYIMKLKNGKLKVAGLSKRIQIKFKSFVNEFLNLLMNLLEKSYNNEQKNVFTNEFNTLIEKFFSDILLNRTTDNDYMFVVTAKPFYEYANLSSFNAVCSYRRNLFGVDINFAVVGELFLSYVLPTNKCKRRKSDSVEFWDRITEMQLPIDKVEYIKRVFNFVSILERHILKTENLFLKFCNNFREMETEKVSRKLRQDKNNFWKPKKLLKRCAILFYYDELFKLLSEYNIHFWDSRDIKNSFQTIVYVGDCGKLTQVDGSVFHLRELCSYLEEHRDIKKLNILLLPTTNFLINSKERLLWFLDILYNRPDSFYNKSNSQYLPDGRLIVTDSENNITIYNT